MTSSLHIAFHTILWSTPTFADPTGSGERRGCQEAEDAGDHFSRQIHDLDTLRSYGVEVMEASLETALDRELPQKVDDSNGICYISSSVSSVQSLGSVNVSYPLNSDSLLSSASGG